jgi:signal transduction histidine kinase
MLTLWILQVLFLNSFYATMKDEQTKNVAKSIESAYESESYLDFLTTVNEISDSNDIFIYIVSSDGNTMYFSPVGNDTDSEYYAEQIKTVNRYMIENERTSAYLRIKGSENGKEVLAYGNVLKSKDKVPLVIYLFSPLWPISSTVEILTNQLIYVTFISLIVACMISFYLSTRITLPIRKITNSAERLAEGEYGIIFRGGHYTEISNLADTLTSASIELEKSDMMQKDLIANVSHDLRTPLTMIKSYAEMIRDLSGDNPEKREEHLKVIIDETDRLNSLVDDLLTISRMQSGKMVLSREDFDITAAANSIISTYKVMEDLEGYTFDFDCPAHFIVNGDTEKIKQVMSNLFTNAIKFCGEDKYVGVSIKKKGKNVICKITDHGEGIAPEELSRVWERYYRSSSNMVRTTEGTGLGLSIVKEILSLHKVKFGVESTLNQGTTFWFEMPFVKIEKDTAI